MTVIGLAQVLKMDDGAKVECVRGKVASVFERSTGVKNNREWSCQKIQIADPANSKTKVTVKVWNKDPLPESLKGKTVMISQSDEGKGLSVKHYSYEKNGKSFSGVDLDLNSGSVEIEGAAQTAAPATVTQPATANQTPEEIEAAELQRKADLAKARAEEVRKAKEQAVAPVSSTQDKQKRLLAIAREADQLVKELGEGTQASAVADPVSFVIGIRKFLARRGNAYRMAMDEGLRQLESFALAHQLAWDEDVKKGFTQLILDKTAESGLFTTLYLGLDRSGLTDSFPTGDIDDLLRKAQERLAAQRAAREAGKEQHD